jgi:putative glutamine amidotransferase
MQVHIAIPEPTSTDTAYNQRSLPPYLAALHSAGAIPVVVPLHERQDRVAKLLQGVEGILLPGSGYDIDPERYGENRIAECGESDPGRAAVDDLLRDAGSECLADRISDSARDFERRSRSRAQCSGGAWG